MGNESKKQPRERAPKREKKTGDICPTPIREWAAPEDEILDAVYDDSPAARDEMFRALTPKDRARIFKGLFDDGFTVSGGLGVGTAIISSLTLPLTYAALGFFASGFFAGRLFRSSYYQEESLGRWGVALSALCVLVLGTLFSGAALGATLIALPFLVGGALLGYGDILYVTKKQ